MEKFKVTVEVEVDGDCEEMKIKLAQYLAHGDDCNFFDDFGYGAWGGYSGPFVVSVAVTDDAGKVLASHSQRGKPCSECGDFPMPEGVDVCPACSRMAKEEEETSDEVG